MANGWVPPEEARVYADEDDESSAYQVIALDPGGTSGWALMCVHIEAVGPDPDVHLFGPYGNLLWWTAGEFTGRQDSQVDKIIDLVGRWPAARLVTEDFRLRRLDAVLSPVEINATVLWATRPRYWVKQDGNLAFETLTDPRQKEQGLWVPGKEHARDAVKHAFTFLKRKKAQAIEVARRTARGARA